MGYFDIDTRESAGRSDQSTVLSWLTTVLLLAVGLALAVIGVLLGVSPTAGIELMALALGCSAACLLLAVVGAFLLRRSGDRHSLIYYQQHDTRPPTEQPPPDDAA